MKTSEIDELIARAEAGEQITLSVGCGPARPVDLDDLHLARAFAALLDQLALDLAPWQEAPALGIIATPDAYIGALAHGHW